MILRKSVLLLCSMMIGGATSWCASVTSLNTSNSALGSDLVVGDVKTTTITGAQPNSPVVVHSFRNNIDQGTATVGSTNAQGAFTVTAHATQASVGDRKDIWSVGGSQVGQIEYEIISVPTSLRVLGVSVANYSPKCPGTFGIDVDVTYKVSSAAGDYDTAVLIEPREDIQFIGPNNVPTGQSSSNDIGPVPGYPTSSEFTDTTGTFHDVPVGACSNGAFANAGANQAIDVMIGSNIYPVRSTTRFVVNGPSAGHGTVTNNLDVTKSR
jgi:hypothetical protein